MTRPHRAFVAVLLALLLLAVQHEGQRHALSHWTPVSDRGQQQSLQATVDTACAECALLAAGANGLMQGPLALAAVALAQVLGVTAPVSAHVSAPRYYRSRAPPYLL